MFHIFIKNKCWLISSNGMLRNKENTSIESLRKLVLLNWLLIVKRRDFA